DFLGGRPDVAQEHGSVAADPERLVVEVDVDAARERVRHDERRRGEIVGADFLPNAPFEVAIPREHRAYDEIAFRDRRGYGLGQRSRVADARRAPVADQVETQRLERLREPGLIEI